MLFLGGVDAATCITSSVSRCSISTSSVSPVD